MEGTTEYQELVTELRSSYVLFCKEISEPLNDGFRLFHANNGIYPCSVEYPEFGPIFNVLCESDYSVRDPDVFKSLILAFLEYAKVLNAEHDLVDSDASKWAFGNLSLLLSKLWNIAQNSSKPISPYRVVRDLTSNILSQDGSGKTIKEEFEQVLFRVDGILVDYAVDKVINVIDRLISVYGKRPEFWVELPKTQIRELVYCKILESVKSNGKVDQTVSRILKRAISENQIAASLVIGDFADMIEKFNRKELLQAIKIIASSAGIGNILNQSVQEYYKEKETSNDASSDELCIGKLQEK
ncbi:hypothetical protein BB560_001200 [Smittium megazygosporum]|uniref:Uncharacterized protein n=1 Tax=Smittium megazygosporum TaxID=133381 RepID=A0A2T9ZIA1_9FUNG|nr:hypothetical protein BB560_001200 [Smittium megazygosporum]